MQTRKSIISVTAALGFSTFLLAGGPKGIPIPKNGFVPNEVTAIKIAIAIWEPIYGESVIAQQKPYKATLKNGVWSVEGSRPKPMPGGVAYVEISKKDGRILKVIHGA